MVFFTCNNCGESVKKPGVEKHYTRCRAGRDKFLSCMDCLKDFRGDEYVTHTKCISEVQKYSGKDYIHKEAKNSGAKKQEGWTDIVHSILENSEYTLSGSARSAFQKLQSYENVPRKQAKFQNFVSNCMRIPKGQAEEVWNVLEKALDKMKQSRQQEVAAAKLVQAASKSGSEEQPSGQKELQNCESYMAEEGELEKKKSKKIKAAANGDAGENFGEPKKKISKKTEHGNGTVNEHERGKNLPKKRKPPASEDEVEIAEEPKKKKSKALSTEENGENVFTVGKKTKKSKPAQHDGEAGHVDEPKSKRSNKSMPTANGNATEHEREAEKEDLKKSSLAEINGVLNKNNPVAKKKSKRANPTEIDGKSENEFATEEPGFVWWSTMLTKVAATRAEGISVEKLKKKALKKYMASVNGEHTSEKLLKTFDKKFKKYLKRTPGLQVEGDAVKTC